MSGRTDDRQRVLEATDLVGLIGEAVTLRPKGREFVGLCPFHDDHKPSMFVNPHKGIFKCFSCGAGGSAFDFVMRFYRMEFPEALRFMAERAGVQLSPPPSRRTRDGEPADDRQAVSSGDLIDAHRIAVSFYRALLRHEQHGRVGREIYARRGISEEMIERFELGVAPGPDRWDGLVQTVTKKGLPLQPFEAAGLVHRRKSSGGHYDRFRHRLIFPIHDALGRPIAFGARQIDPEDEPKYLNSPEHPRFRKSETLYGLHLARPAIQKLNRAVVVEGYTDVIASHQAGVTEVVATLGTSLTRDHARVLQRLCDRVVLIFDGDEAGQKAADRAVEVFFASSVDVRIAVIPGGQDPADLLKEPDGVERFRRLIDDGVEALDFLLASLRRQVAQSGDGISARQRLIEAFGSRLSALGFHQMNALRRDLTLSRLSDALGVSADVLLRAIPRTRRRPAAVGVEAVASASDEADHGAGEPPDVPPARLAAERDLVACLVHSPRVLDHVLADGTAVARAVDPAWITQTSTRRLLEHLLQLDRERRTSSELMASLAGDPLSALAGDLHWEVSRLTADRDSEVIARLESCLAALKQFMAEEEYQRAASAGLDPDRARDLVALLRAQGSGNRRRAPRAEPFRREAGRPGERPASSAE